MIPLFAFLIVAPLALFLTPHRRTMWGGICAFGRWINDHEHCTNTLLRSKHLRAELEAEQVRLYTI